MTDLHKLSYVAAELGIPYHLILQLIKDHHLGTLRPGPRGYGLSDDEVRQVQELLKAREASPVARHPGRPALHYHRPAPDTLPPMADPLPATPPPGPWYTVPDAAQRLRLPAELVRRYVDAGVGARAAAGSRGRLNRDDLETIQHLVRPARLGQGYLRPFYNGTLLLCPPPGSGPDALPTWCGPDTPRALAQSVREAAIWGHQAVIVGQRRVGLTMVDGRPRLAEMDEVDMGGPDSA